MCSDSTPTQVSMTLAHEIVTEFCYILMEKIIQIVIPAIKWLTGSNFLVIKLMKQTVLVKKSHYFVIPDLRRMLCIALNAGVFSMPSKPLNLRSASSARSMNLSASLPSKVGIALISIAIIFLSFLQNFCRQEQRKLAFKLPGVAKVYAKVTICLEMASIKDHFLDYGKRIRHKIICLTLKNVE